MNYFDFLDTIKILSHIPALIFLIQKKKIVVVEFNVLFLLIILSLSSQILSLIFFWSHINVFPVFHIWMFVRFILLLEFFKRDKLLEGQIKYIYFLGTLVFIYESLICKLWLQNNELFTIFSNVFISYFSLRLILKCFSRVVFSTQDNFKLILYIIFFVSNSSALILSIYETEIRQETSGYAFFLVLFYCLLDIIQNFGITYSLWKLKEA